MKTAVLSIYIAAILASVAGVTWLLQTYDSKRDTLSNSRQPGDSGVIASDSCCTPGMAGAISGASVYQLESEWTTQRGGRMRLSRLAGKTRVVAMFYSRCTYACPMTINDMKRIDTSIPHNLRKNVGFVLVSFDPAHDTPQALRDLADRDGLDGARWTLLTGSTHADRTLAALLGVEFEKKTDGTFTHSVQITVLNAAGEIVYKHFGLNQPVNDVAQVIERCSAQPTNK